MKAKLIKAVLIGLIPIVSGCATLKESLLLGVGTGAAAGTGLGLVVEQSPGSALIGAGIGAAIGATLGFLTHKRDEEKDIALKLSTHSNKSNDEKVPLLTAPSVRRMWQEDSIEGDKYISGHWVYILEKPTVWSK